MPEVRRSRRGRPDGAEAGLESPMNGAELFALKDAVHDGRRTLALVGELDRVTVPSLQKVLREVCAEDTRELVLELHQLKFVDEAGLECLLWASGLCADHGCALLLSGTQPNVRRIFVLTGVSGRLSFIGSRGSA
jgi:anti-sigma B factor antagonist